MLIVDDFMKVFIVIKAHILLSKYSLFFILCGL